MLVDISKGIAVGGFQYKVDTSEEARIVITGNQNNGECDNNSRIIRLDRCMGATQMNETFIHEVIEAVNHVYCNGKLEHEKITQLGYGLHQVMESLGIQFGVK